MNNVKIKLLSLTLLISFLISGCSSILFLKNTPTIVRDEPQTQRATLLDYQYLTAGVVQSYDPNTQTMFLIDRSSAAPASNAINTFDQSAENKLSNLILSDKIHHMVRYDESKEGIYYLQQDSATNGNLDTGIGNQQLMWTSLDKSITETISNPNFSVTSPFCFFDDNSVLYANSKNEIIVTNHNQYRKVYKNVENHQISQLAYDPDLNTMIYIGQTPKDEEKRLYMVEMEEENLKPTLLDSDVPYFDYNRHTGTLVYIQETNTDNKLYTYNLRDPQPPLILYNGNIRRVFIAPDDSGIFFTRGTNPTDKPLEAIYYSDLQGKTVEQITSPLNLASPIIIEPKSQALYFSVESSQSTEAIGDKMNDVYVLHYRLHEDLSEKPSSF